MLLCKLNVICTEIIWAADDDKKKNKKIYVVCIISILITCRKVATLSVQKLNSKVRKEQFPPVYRSRK
jgi:hypothetical protein